MTAVELNRVPGMTEPVEQQFLFDCGSQAALEPGDMLVDFGPFLGRSTYYLASGLAKNPTRSDNNKVVAYDCFTCRRSSQFFQRVWKPIAQAKIQNLLRDHDELVDWRRCTEYFLREYLPKIITLQQCTLFDSYPKIEQYSLKSIAVLHIDSPKKWDDFRPILFRFFPLLKKNSIVIFQDYFYHWSATLVAGVQHMIADDILVPIKNNASSMVFKLNSQITPDKAIEVDLKIQSRSSETAETVLEALRYIQKYAHDRPSIFIPRLYLAAIQDFHARNQYEKAAFYFQKLTDYVLKEKAHPSVLLNYSELLQFDHKMPVF